MLLRPAPTPTPTYIQFLICDIQVDKATWLPLSVTYLYSCDIRCDIYTTLRVQSRSSYLARTGPQVLPKG